MRMFSFTKSCFRLLFRRRQIDADLDDEIRSAVDLLADEKIKAGISPDQARRAARIDLGGVEQVKEKVRSGRAAAWLDSFLQDIRFAFRMLRKSPAFTAVAILTLALGIGANTAIFSLMDTVMLRLLPVQHPDELLQVASMTHGFGHSPRLTYTNPIWEAFEKDQNVFAGVFAWGTDSFNLSPNGVVDEARGLYVSGSYFTVLGVRPATGRLIGADDDKRGCPGVAVLGYGFWQTHFGGAPAIGNTLSLDGHPFQVIGVSAAGFMGTEVGREFDIAVPICSEAIVEGANSSLNNRAAWWFRVMARRKAGTSDPQISAHLDVLSHRVFAETVPTNWKPEDQRGFLQWTLTAMPAGTGFSHLRSEYNLPLQVLMAIAGFVLLLACANVASLMLARATSRSKEMGVRLMLGASRRRLVRQLLTESMLLSCSGALLGILFASWGSRLMVRSISTMQDKVSLDLTLDGRVLAFTAAVAVLTGLLFGVLPAFKGTRVSLIKTIKGVSESNEPGGTKLRAEKWTVAAQIAVSLVLVTTAGLFLRSFANLVTLDPGFDRNNVLLANVDVSNAIRDGAPGTITEQQILQRVRSLPGVTAAGESLITPISHRFQDDYIVVGGPKEPKGDDRDVSMNYITAGYFAALRSRLIAGRDFNDGDGPTGVKVAIVNEVLAKKFYPDIDPIGQTFRRYATATTLGDTFLIVGLTQDAKYDTLRDDSPPTAYFPLAQMVPVPAGVTVEVRTVAQPAALEASVQEAILSVNKSAAIQFTTLKQQVDDSVTQERLLATLSGFFGALALLLATIGLYGVLAYLLLQRQKEIGIRLALGADPNTILSMLIKDVAVLLASGCLVGLIVAWTLSRFIQNLLFHLPARDADTFAMSGGALALVALVAAFVPGRRAMRVDPVVALRHE